MAQVGKRLRVEDKLSKVDRTSKNGKWRRGRDVRLTVRIDNCGVDDFEGAEEQKLTGVEFRERYNILPVVSDKFKAPDLLGTRENQCHSAGWNIVMDNDI